MNVIHVAICMPVPSLPYTPPGVGASEPPPQTASLPIQSPRTHNLMQRNPTVLLRLAISLLCQTVSNVPGPQEPVKFAGVRLRRIHFAFSNLMPQVQPSPCKFSRHSFPPVDTTAACVQTRFGVCAPDVTVKWVLPQLVSQPPFFPLRVSARRTLPVRRCTPIICV